MKKFFIGTLATFGALFILLFLAAFIIRQIGLQEYAKKPMVLQLDFSNGVVERHDDAFPLLNLTGRKSMLYKVVRAIDIAAKDPRVKGIVVRLDQANIGIAQCQEIRNAIMHFRGKGNHQGKFSFAFADTFGDMGSGIVPYFLATAFDQIWLQPVGILSITGLSAEVPFAKEAADNLGVKAHIIRRGEFKSLFESLTEKDFSPQNREAIQNILSSLLNLMIRDIAVARELTESEVQEAVDNAPLIGSEALKLGLIDHLGYWDQVLDAIQENIDETVRYISPENYLELVEKDEVKDGEPKFALITAEGTIQRAGHMSLMDSFPVNASRIAASFRQARNDPDVKAIILRLNSAGGSPVGSETIWRSVIEAKKSGIPVIVTMSDYAASGAYWIASAATKIVSHSSTITGSIGVITGKIVMDKFWQNLGVNWSVLSEGQNAELWSQAVPYTQEGEQKIDSLVNHLYEVFIEKVVSGRGLTEEHVRQIAKGRAWSGEDALRYGLVDQLGGFKEAIELAQNETGLQGQFVPIVSYPRRKSILEQIYDVIENKDTTVSFETATFISQLVLTEIKSFLLENILKITSLLSPEYRIYR